MISRDRLIEDFPILNDITYLDSASTSLTPRPVVDAMNDYYLNYNSNTGRGSYKIAIKSTNKVEQTREKIAKLLNTASQEIIFTKNTTEAINLIANGLNFNTEDNIIISNIEHHSNFIPWVNKSIDIRIAKAKNYVVEPDSISDLINKNTKLIAISHITNAFGSIQDIEEIIKIAHEMDVLVLVDSAQSAGHTEIDIKKLNPDFMAFPGHKGLLGPTGTGFLYLKEELSEEIKPSNLGGGTVTSVNGINFKLEEPPSRFEGGTLNIGGIIGLNAGIDYLLNFGIPKIENHINNLTKMLYKGLQANGNVTIYGNPNNIHGIVSFNINGLNPYDVGKILDETDDICLRSGFHCAIPGLKSVGANEGTVRGSFHVYNTKEDVEKLIYSIEELSQFT
ncbi:cysteine desulfurase [Methanobrevibacter filiformis]|uniref:cysteine desulfurase n=1 Tax=Methanobrevibacter filiformis TaxID=55758 RepID=A0A165ZP41_9EURY|nr:cysteine desulfurase [Methanobrevibacter filiformis]KZX10974.1 cysteine desulfurase SufS [Methanobrevibacter filiformis]